MKKFTIYAVVILSILFVAFAILSRGKKENQPVMSASTSTSKEVKSPEKPKNLKPAEKIQVFLFHSTQRCPSCIAIGKFAKETVEQNFAPELKSGKIEFKEINIDLPENEALASKFQATGSALFINPIIDGKDNIEEDTRVWRLVSNEQEFISYLTDKIKKLL